MGKSALLGYLSDRAAGWHVARAVGVESEMELAYAGLHQLCAPMLDQLGRLPVPQRDALATVFGRSAGAAPDRFLVGLATLTLFAEVAEQQPLACLVDDAQWLDRASAQILGFVAWRLLAERIAVVCAARTGAGDDVLAGLPELSVRGLGDSDARALLLANVPGPLDAAVCDQIVMESHGNPLALLELLVEAAARAGNPGLARDALERLAEVTQRCGTDVALGVEARSRALLSYGIGTDRLYRVAIDHLGRTRLRPELGRAHLLYGEWLRREGRRADARAQLRTAHDLFTAIGMEAFAERTGRELLATGEKVRKRSPDTRDELTPQEEQIARLARDGLSNPEIGAQLFVSARTVEWHLRNVFSKLGITSRRQLRTALPQDGRVAGRA